MRLTSIEAGNWSALVEAAGFGGMVRQFALNCTVKSFLNDALTLLMDESLADRRSRSIEEKLAQGLAKYLGREIRVLFEIAESEVDSPARQRLKAEQERVARAATAFESDPAVKGLRERFGADIDTGSIKPTN